VVGALGERDAGLALRDLVEPPLDARRPRASIARVASMPRAGSIGTSR
jgi:hypothetical protein